VATERTMLAMPETAIGLFPDVGATWFLNRLPGEMGVYLGLGGIRLRANDLCALGMATHHVASSAAPALIDDLAAQKRLDRAAIDATLARHATDPANAVVAARRGRIDALFAGSTVEAICDALATASEDWAQDALAALRRASPTSLKLTLRQLRGGRGLDLQEIFRIEYRLAVRCADGQDFPEGVRAILVDKDNAPRWQPDRFEAVDPAEIESYFAPFGTPSDELAL
jgi:enoyl-CoA hydratase